jgi:1-acyl-sn-glycerol-3-phosphate acyltransferase
MAFRSRARGYLAVARVALLFLRRSFLLRLWVVPLSWVRPSQRRELGSRFFQDTSRKIVDILRSGGTQFRRVGTIRTDRASYVVANHQGLIDILQVSLLGGPFAPALIARKRYARFIPLVSQTMRMIDCPIVDPKRDPRGAIEVLKEAARQLEGALVIFAEGHRTKDGEVKKFRPAGILAMLSARRLPVYVVANDGVWQARRLVDFFSGLHEVSPWAEALGPFLPPEDDSQLPAFIDELRALIVRRVAEHRSGLEDAPAAVAESGLVRVA